MPSHDIDINISRVMDSWTLWLRDNWVRLDDYNWFPNADHDTGRNLMRNVLDGLGPLRTWASWEPRRGCHSALFVAPMIRMLGASAAADSALPASSLHLVASRLSSMAFYEDTLLAGPPAAFRLMARIVRPADRPIDLEKEVTAVLDDSRALNQLAWEGSGDAPPDAGTTALVGLTRCLAAEVGRS